LLDIAVAEAGALERLGECRGKRRRMTRRKEDRDAVAEEHGGGMSQVLPRLPVHDGLAEGVRREVEGGNPERTRLTGREARRRPRRHGCEEHGGTPCPVGGEAHAYLLALVPSTPRSIDPSIRRSVDP
jgi:hypothetical protein